MIIITIKIDTGEGSRVTFEGAQEDTTRLPDTMSEGKVSGTTKLPADTRVPSTKDPSTQGPSTQDPDTCTKDNCSVSTCIHSCTCNNLNTCRHNLSIGRNS